jgi:hypothetical protein
MMCGRPVSPNRLVVVHFETLLGQRQIHLWITRTCQFILAKSPLVNIATRRREEVI